MALAYRPMNSQGTEIEVLNGGLPIARISEQAPSISPGREVGWAWRFMISAGPHGFRRRGFAESLASAMRSVDHNWSLYLAGAPIIAVSPADSEHTD